MYRQQSGMNVMGLIISGIGVAALWIHVCHPQFDWTLIDQSDLRDLMTLGVLVLASVVVVTVIGAAWMSILSVLMRIVQLAMIAGFGFGCWMTWQNYRDKHHDAPLPVLSPVRESVPETLAPAPVAAHRNYYWQQPKRSQ